MLKNISVKIALLLTIGLMSGIDLYAQTRIRFARGKSSATVSGKVGSGGSRSYILGARAGQTLTVRVSSRNGQVSADIGGNDVGTGDTIQLRSTDDYIITINNNGGSTNYSLYVSIR